MKKVTGVRNMLQAKIRNENCGLFRIKPRKAGADKQDRSRHSGQYLAGSQLAHLFWKKAKDRIRCSTHRLDNRFTPRIAFGWQEEHFAEQPGQSGSEIRVTHALADFLLACQRLLCWRQAPVQIDDSAGLEST